MNLKRFLSTTLTAVFITFWGHCEFTFKEHSLLASGKWVKIEIDGTGIYSISYDQLREMGFTAPDKVGVFGKGGKMMCFQLSTNSSPSAGANYDDDLTQTPSLHSNDALIFWGEGIENVYMQPGTKSTGDAPYLENYRQNIYSKTAYYFLCDSEEVLSPTEAQTTAGTFNPLSKAWGFARHEVDLQMNSTNTGNLFWGESFINDSPAMSWKVPVSNMDSGTAHLSYQVYSGPNDKFTLRAKCSAGGNEKVSNVTNTNVNYFFPLLGRLAADPYKYATPDTIRFVANPQQEVEISIAAENINANYLNLDYWLLTYPKAVKSNPLSSSQPAELYYFNATRNTNYMFPLDEGLCAWDVSDSRNIQSLPRVESDSEFVGFRLTSNAALPVAIFDPKRKQKQISGWAAVDNINIHGKQEEGIELLIVSTPKLRDYAERLADLHRKYDKIKVLVVTPEEIYNEFSGGVPDPMAYRAVAKMFYNNGLKNILLFGPSMRNMLADVPGETHFDHHIALQHSYVKPEEESVPAYDFYGVMTDNPVEASLHVEQKEIGVGLLSCETPEDCERIIRKIEHYLTDESRAWYVNESLTIGGTGDIHLHDEQAIDTGEYMKKLPGNDGMAHNTLIIDAYGKEDAGNQFKSFLNRGKIWSVYFGHGAGTTMGPDAHFFTTGDLVRLKNNHTGFIFMGGCDFSLPDVRVRGIGESFVLDTEHGMIGAIVSTRTAWSSQNKYLGDILTKEWLNPTDKYTTSTIGEIFAKAKSNSNALNHLSFVLVADPALKVPSPAATIALDPISEASAGEKVSIGGNILNADGEVDSNFNGKVVLKLMEPAVTLRSRDYATGTCDTQVEGENGYYYPVLDVPYEATIMTAVETEVKNGKFTAEIAIPATAADFSGETVKITAGAFDNSRWLGGAGSVSFCITNSPSSTAHIDNEAPAIVLGYDSSRQIVSFDISDDTAVSLDPNQYIATIDGKRVEISNEEYFSAGETANRFKGYCNVTTLSEGAHTITIEATDIAGNKASQVYEFTKQPTTAPLLLTLESKAGVDRISGFVEGEYSGSLIVEITDGKGVMQTSFSASGSEFEWDLCDISGKRVPEGYYRVCVRSNEEVHPKYSEWVEFAVLRPIE